MKNLTSYRIMFTRIKDKYSKTDVVNGIEAKGVHEDQGLFSWCHFASSTVPSQLCGSQPSTVKKI